jgi:hypothetical protein
MSAVIFMGIAATPMGVAEPVREVHWLLVHDLHDAAGAWLGRQWKRRLPPNQRQDLLVLPTPALTLHTRAQLRIAEGRTQSLLRVCLPCQEECRISSDTLRGVLWRADGVWVKGDPATDMEAAYALQERQALLLAWLHGLGPACATRPRADRLAGPRWSGATWRTRAAACGLPVMAPIASPVAVVPSLFVVGNMVVPLARTAASPAVAEAARLLADQEGCAQLLLYGTEAGGHWHFVQADPCPDLRMAGSAADRLVDALAARLGMGSESLTRSA